MPLEGKQFHSGDAADLTRWVNKRQTVEPHK